jgi:WD40 repeat protein
MIINKKKSFHMIKKIIFICILPIVVKASAETQVVPKNKTILNMVSNVQPIQEIIAQYLDIWEELKTLDSHAPVAYSPDGKYLATSSQDDLKSKIILNNLKDSEKNAHINLHTVLGINALAYSFDNKYMAYAIGRSIYIYDASTWQHIHTIETHHNNGIESLAFSADGRNLASGSNKGITIWDMNTFTVIQHLDDHKNTVVGLAYTSDGKYLAAGDMAYTIKIRDAQSYKIVQSIDTEKQVTALAYSSDNTLLAVSLVADDTIRLLNTHTYKLKSSIKIPNHYTISLSFSPYGNLACASREKVKIFRNQKLEFDLLNSEHENIPSAPGGPVA